MQNKPITVLVPGKIGSYFHFYFGFYSVIKREVRRKWKHSDSLSFESHPRTLLTMYTVWISLHSKRLVGSQFEAWAKELLRFAALWLGRKTQTLSGTSQKPGRPQPSGTGLVKQCSQELMLENFCRALPSDPTDCPWISDDDFTAEYDYIDSLCTAVLSPQTKSRRETSVSQSLSPRFFLGEGRLYTGYLRLYQAVIDWQFYCFHWSLANYWPPREACIRLKDWCKMWLNEQKDPSTFFFFFFFSSFHDDQFANIHWHCWRERLKIRKLPS